MHCLTCNYDLSQLTEHRCPECGRAFDPANPETFFHLAALELHCNSFLKKATICAAVPVAWVILLMIGEFLAPTIDENWTDSLIGLIIVQVVIASDAVHRLIDSKCKS